jgi:hypothetical protein
MRNAYKGCREEEEEKWPVGGPKRRTFVRIILKWILKNHGVRVLTEFMWLRIGSLVGSCEHGFTKGASFPRRICFWSLITFFFTGLTHFRLVSERKKEFCRAIPVVSISLCPQKPAKELTSCS